MPQNLSVPIAIIVAGALIAGALYFAGRTASPSTQGGNNQQQKTVEIPAVTTSDHILGNPDADVVIVEYTDFECPFCKQFHATMKQIMSEYGADGKVAWVLRNFPLSQLHPNAPKLAEAAECVAELGGNTAYWNFLDEVFTIAPVNVFFPLDQLSATAVKAGVDKNAFDSCLASGKYKDKVQQEFNDAIAAGGQGTPYSVVVLKSGEKIELPGAQPYATVKNVIDTVLAGGQPKQ